MISLIYVFLLPSFSSTYIIAQRSISTCRTFLFFLFLFLFLLFEFSSDQHQRSNPSHPLYYLVDWERKRQKRARRDFVGAKGEKRNKHERAVVPHFVPVVHIFCILAGKVNKKNEEESVGVKIMIGDNDTYEFEHVAGAIELLPMVLEQREGRGQLLQAAAYKLEICQVHGSICKFVPIYPLALFDICIFI